jgi:nucleoid DNA-binding protein
LPRVSEVNVISHHKEEVMNKSGLIEVLSRRENLTEKRAIDVVSLVFKGFTDELKKGGRIEIRGFGSFVVRKYDAYTERASRFLPKSSLSSRLAKNSKRRSTGRSRQVDLRLVQKDLQATRIINSEHPRGSFMIPFFS